MKARTKRFLWNRCKDIGFITLFCFSMTVGAIAPFASNTPKWLGVVGAFSVAVTGVIIWERGKCPARNDDD